MLPECLPVTSKWTPPLGTAFVWPKPPGLSGYCVSLLAQTRHSLFDSLVSKSLAGCQPSPLIVWRCCGRVGGLQKCVTSPSSLHNYSWQQLQQSGRCHLHLQCFRACECCIVNRPLLTVLFSADQQGSINERPLTIRSQLWLSEHSTVCPSNTQLPLPDNCVIRVCINNWSTNRDMYYSPVCLIC